MIVFWFNSYVALRGAVQEMQLDNNTEDSIRWRWTADREYTTKSAYRVQFEGTFSKLKIMPIWKAVTEPKYRFFFRMDIAAQEDSHRK